MFFDNDDLTAKVMDVMHFKWKPSEPILTPPLDFLAISYRKSGRSEFTFTAGSVNAAEGSISLFPEKTPYSRVSEEDELYVIHFKLYGKNPSSIEVFYPNDRQRYEEIFKDIFKNWDKKCDGYHLRCNGLFNELIYRIYKEGKTTTEDREISPATLAARMIEERISDTRFSLCEISESMNISDAYLRKIFRQHYGITLKEYQMTRRMEHAALLLHTEDLLIKEIAQRCGFSDEKYFSKAFKHKYGYSPSEMQRYPD